MDIIKSTIYDVCFVARIRFIIVAFALLTRKAREEEQSKKRLPFLDPWWE